jgi:hypothetical protein
VSLAVERPPSSRKMIGKGMVRSERSSSAQLMGRGIKGIGGGRGQWKKLIGLCQRPGKGADEVVCKAGIFRSSPALPANFPYTVPRF